MVARNLIAQGNLTYQQWQRLQALLPKPSPQGGRPAKDQPHDHQWHTLDSPHGCTYSPSGIQERRDLPDCYGPWETVAGRF